MARPRKTTLNYFNMDVNFVDDERIVGLVTKKGCMVYSIIMILTTCIYEKGYYLKLNELTKLKMLHKLPGVTEEFFDDCLAFLCKYDYFDSGMFAQGILTSKDIQERYFEATKRWVKLDNPKYLLVECNRASFRPAIDENVESTADRATEMAQATANAENPTPKASAETAGVEGIVEMVRTEEVKESEKGGFVPPTPEEVLAFMYSPKLRDYSPEVKDVTMFIAYWDTRGWKIDGHEMENWRGAFVSWLGKKIKFGEASKPKKKDVPDYDEIDRRCALRLEQQKTRFIPTNEFLYNTSLNSGAPKELVEMFKRKLDPIPEN